VRVALTRMGFGRPAWQPTPGIFQTNSFSFRISRGMALDFGLAEPTEEEAAERAVQAAEYRRKRDADWTTYLWAREALDALDAERNPIARRVLDLHRPDESSTWVTCAGCDWSGYDGEAPEWPCRTVREIAGFHGIELPTGHLTPPETKRGDT